MSTATPNNNDDALPCTALWSNKLWLNQSSRVLGRTVPILQFRETEAAETGIQLASAGAGPEISSLISESPTLSTAQDAGERVSSGWQIPKEWNCLPRALVQAAVVKARARFVPS